MRVWLEDGQRSYVLAVSCDHPVWVDGRQQRVDIAFAALSAAAWQRLSAGEGSQGPRLYDWAWLPVGTAGSTGLAYYRAYGLAETSLADVARVAGARWAIEGGFERAKDLVGLDQYEVRRWQPWYRHLTLALLAHAYLEVTRAHATAAPNGDGGKKGGQIRRVP